MNPSPDQLKKEERLLYYQKQREARLRQRHRKLNKRRIALFASLLLCIAIGIPLIGFVAQPNTTDPDPTGDQVQANQSQQPDYIDVGTVTFRTGYTAEQSPSMATIADTDIASSQVILMDASNNTIIAQRDGYSTVSPASMTKILTILVAAEHITNLDDSFTITRDITDYVYQNKCSAVGFLDGETVPVRDLFYGTILPSGADAAVALATYTAGSHEAFVDLMNQKLDELGLADSAHFTNCVGLYDSLHYCTAYDMAIIMKAALENDWCRQVLSLHNYTTVSTAQHPDGLTISNWFLRRIEDKDSGGQVIAAKTGFVNQSGNCSASYAISNSGVPYICVSVNAFSSWRCIYDHVAIYSRYAP